jgi:DNA-binding CsgD family transcriptional regulator
MVDEHKEKFILQALANGKELDYICKELHISIGQYYYHIALMRAKHEARNTAQLVAIGFRKKLVV